MKKINILFVMLAATALFQACGNSSEKKYNEGINIIPMPKTLVQKEGTFSLNSGTKFVADVNQPGIGSIVNYFSGKINTSTGYDLKLTAEMPSSNYISIAIDPTLALNDEGYTLTVTSKGAVITGKTAHGAFYGMQSFMQLLPAEIESATRVKGVAWTAPNVEITDEPRFGYRGMHMDICRHFSGVDYVKKQLDVLSLFKINTLHWHLTDDQGWRIEIKKYPLLTEIGSKRIEGDGTIHEGFFTQDQIREVVAYASERFIEIIPEIELPGHAVAALTAYPEYSCTGGPFEVRNTWGISDDVFCPGNDSTIVFVNNIIDEVAALFPGRYIHIGGDECPTVRWEECPKCKALMKKHGLKNGAELRSWFMAQVEKNVIRNGKRIIGWEEILEGGTTPSTIVMSWTGEKGGITAANTGHDAIMTPADPLYLDRYEGDSNIEPIAIGSYAPLERVYNYDPIPDTILPDKRHHILGAQGNVWTEYLHTPASVEYRAYPRILAVSELTWTPKDKKNWEDFVRRLNNALVRLDMHHINYHIPLPEGPVTKVVGYTDRATVEFHNTRNYPMVYTLDGKDPGAKSNLYSKPLEFEKDGIIKIATVLPTGKMSNVRTVEVKKMALLPAFEGETNEGMTVKIAEGTYLNETEYSKAAFGQEQIVTSFTDIKYSDSKPCVAIHEGYFEVPEDGIYIFGTDMERLYVDDVLVCDSEGVMRRHMRNKGMIGLATGKHSFKAVFNNRMIDGFPSSWNRLGFSYKAPSSDEFTRVANNMITH